MAANNSRGYGGSIAVIAAAVLSVSAFALLSCQTQPTAPPAATKASTAPAAAPTQPIAPGAVATSLPVATQAPETIKVGVVYGLSGPAAKQGLNLTRWNVFAMDDINARGGIKVAGKTYRFEGVVVDDKNSSEGGREAANKLVLADKARFIVGPGSSSIAGMQPLTEPNKVVILAGGVADKLLGTENPLTLQTGSSHSRMRSTAMYDWLVQQYPNVKRVAIVHADDVGGRSQTEISERDAVARGLTVVSKEFFPVDMKDGTPLIIRVLRTNPDAIDIESFDKVSLWLLLQQSLDEQGFKGVRFGGTIDGGSVSQGYKYLEGFTGASLIDWKASVVNSDIKGLIERFIQKYGEADSLVSPVVHYNNALVLAQAMEKAGTVEDTAKIVTTLQGGQWDTIYSKDLGKIGFSGEKTFGRRAVLDQAIYLSKQENGKPVTFKVMKGGLP